MNISTFVAENIVVRKDVVRANSISRTARSFVNAATSKLFVSKVDNINKAHKLMLQ